MISPGTAILELHGIILLDSRANEKPKGHVHKFIFACSANQSPQILYLQGPRQVDLILPELGSPSCLLLVAPPESSRAWKATTLILVCSRILLCS